MLAKANRASRILPWMSTEIGQAVSTHPENLKESAKKQAEHNFTHGSRSLMTTVSLALCMLYFLQKRSHTLRMDQVRQLDNMTNARTQVCLVDSSCAYQASCRTTITTRPPNGKSLD